MKKIFLLFSFLLCFLQGFSIQGIVGPGQTCLYQSYGYTDTSGGGVGSYYMTNGKAVISINGALMTVLSPGLDTVIFVYNGTADTDKLGIAIYKNVSPIYGTTEFCINTTSTLHDSVTSGIWTSGNTLVATVGSSSGIVTPLTSGTASITLTHTNTACAVTSVNTTVTIDTFPNVISYSNDSVCARTLSPILAFFVDTPTRSGTYMWSSSNNAIATVGNSGGTGIVYGISQGSATISYTLVNTCGANYATQLINVSVPAAPIFGPRMLYINSGAVYTNTTVGGSWYLADSTYASIQTATGILTTNGTPVNILVYYIDTNNCGITYDTVTVTILSNYLPGIQLVFDSINYTANFVTSNATQFISKAIIDPITGASVFVDQETFRSAFVDQETGNSAFIDAVSGRSAFVDESTSRSVFINEDGTGAIKQPFIVPRAVTALTPFTYLSGSIIIAGFDAANVLQPIGNFTVGLDNYSAYCISSNSIANVSNFSVSLSPGGTVTTTFTGYVLLLNFQP